MGRLFNAGLSEPMWPWGLPASSEVPTHAAPLPGPRKMTPERARLVTSGLRRRKRWMQGLWPPPSRLLWCWGFGDLGRGGGQVSDSPGSQAGPLALCCVTLSHAPPFSEPQLSPAPLWAPLTSLRDPGVGSAL